MIAYINLNSKRKGEISRFLSRYYNNKIYITENQWQKKYSNPIEIADIVGIYTDNSDEYNIDFWICLDEGLIFKVTNKNGNDIIKYLFERYPY